MEDILTFELIKGAYVPIMGLMFFLAGYVATDKLFLHECVLFINGKKSIAVFFASAPIGLLYIAFNSEEWQSVLVTFLATNGLYEYFLKTFKKYLP
jgi:predicted membrane-bound spermidine synthase